MTFTTLHITRDRVICGLLRSPPPRGGFRAND